MGGAGRGAGTQWHARGCTGTHWTHWAIVLSDVLSSIGTAPVAAQEDSPSDDAEHAGEAEHDRYAGRRGLKNAPIFNLRVPKLWRKSPK
mgnify:CR=1 FL=1